MTSPRTSATSPPRRGRRMLAAGVALGLTTMAVAPAAMAADEAWTVKGWNHQGSVQFTNGSSTTALIQIRNTSGQTLDTYCIQRTVPTGTGDGKTELDWSSSGISNLNNVAWILNHSYPTVSDVKVLEAAVETHLGGGADLDLDTTEAVAGTQAAIWHYTDAATISRSANSDVVALYDYLTDPTLNTGVQESPATLALQGPTEDAYLDLSRDNVVGPFTVSTSIAEVAVSSTGGPVVDAQGNPVTAARNGDELFVSVPTGTDPGSATVTVSGTGTMPVGRVFAPIPGKRTQTLITATSRSVSLSDSRSANWFAKPDTELPPVEPPVDPPVDPEVPVDPPVQPPVEPPVTPTDPVTPTEPERPETVPPTVETPDSTETEEVVDAEEAEDTTESEVTAGAEELAHTGGSLTAAVLGAGLLAGGAGLVVAKRRHEA